MTILRVIAKFCLVLLSLSTAFTTKTRRISQSACHFKCRRLWGKTPPCQKQHWKLGAQVMLRVIPCLIAWSMISPCVSECSVSIISIKLVVGQSGCLLEACYGGTAAAQGIKTPLLFLPHNLTSPLFTFSSSSPSLFSNNQKEFEHQVKEDEEEARKLVIVLMIQQLNDTPVKLIV